jgi:hypothetical protein
VRSVANIRKGEGRKKDIKDFSQKQKQNFNDNILTAIKGNYT